MVANCIVVAVLRIDQKVFRKHAILLAGRQIGHGDGEDLIHEPGHKAIAEGRIRSIDVYAADPFGIGIGSCAIRSNFLEQGGHALALVLLISFFPVALTGDVAPNIRSVFDGGQTLTID